MFGAAILASALLASTAIAQMNQLMTAWTASPGSSVFDFTPKDFPIDPNEGWNFTTTKQSDGVSAYFPPLFDGTPQIYTNRTGAKMTAHFYGYGATVRGRVFEDSTITLTLNGNDHLTNTTEHQGSMQSHKLVELSAEDQKNKWRTMTIMVNKGGMQLHNVSFLQTVTMGFQDVRDSPSVGVNATQFDADEIDQYYHTTGSWKTEKLLDPNNAAAESPHAVGEPGATISFRTWPGASTLVMRGIHGREAGEIKYKIEPSPHDGFPGEITANLARPIEGVNYFAEVVLDPTMRYNVTITNSDPQRKFKYSVVYYYLSSDTYKNWTPAEDLPKDETKDKHDEDGTNLGAIVGGVVGGVGGAALLAGLLFFLWRRSRSPNPLEDDDKFVVDDTAMASAMHVTPMPLPAGAANKPSYPGTATTSEGQQLLSHGTPSPHRTSFSLSSSGQTYVPHQPFHPPQEADAGPIGGMDTVPPSYNPAWAGPSSGSDPDGTAPSNSYSRSSFMSSTPSQGALHLHGGYDQKNLRAMDEAAEEEPRPEAPPLPTKTKPPGS